MLSPLNGLVVWETTYHRGQPSQTAEGDQIRPGALFMRVVDISDMIVNAAVNHAAERMGRRGVVVILSDLLEHTDSILAAVRRLRHNKHEVILLHLLDRDERTFPFERMTRFEGLEDMPQVMADPAALRTQYLKELDSFTRTLRRGCLGCGADFVEIDTTTPLDVALSSYLASRAKRR